MNPEDIVCGGPDDVYGDPDERENIEGAYEQQDETSEEQEVEMWLSPEARVLAGVEWLYEVEPDWLSRIDLDRLNIASGGNCIAGQLSDCCYRCFFEDHGYRDYDERDSFAKAHGFIGVTFGESDDAALTVAWKQAINALRS